MKFLIKAAFWLGVVVLLLPAPQDPQQPADSKVSTADAIAFLSTAVSDIKGFCERNPDSCVTGAAAARQFGVKAQYGAKVLHEFISEKVEKGEDLVLPEGSREKRTVNQTAKVSVNQSTLKAEDMQPAWRDPKKSGQS